MTWSNKIFYISLVSFFASFIFSLGQTAAFWFVDEVGIDHWNELDDNYAFVYVKPEKGSKKVLVKCLVMNNKLLVDALADGASEPVHLEIKYAFGSFFICDYIIIIIIFKLL